MPQVDLQNGASTVRQAGSKAGDGFVSQFHGKYYTQAAKGNLFIGSQAVGGAVVPIVSNTTQQCGILNPASSGVNASLVKLTIGSVSTNSIMGNFVLGYITAGNGIIATGGKGVVAATLATPVNANLLGPSSKVLFMASAITTVAPSLLMTLGLSTLVLTAADATNPIYSASYDFDGSVVIPPGCGVFFAANVAILHVAQASFVWEEVPVE